MNTSAKKIVHNLVLMLDFNH